MDQWIKTNLEQKRTDVKKNYQNTMIMYNYDNTNKTRTSDFLSPSSLEKVTFT